MGREHRLHRVMAIGDEKAHAATALGVLDPLDVDDLHDRLPGVVAILRPHDGAVGEVGVGGHDDVLRGFRSRERASTRRYGLIESGR